VISWEHFQAEPTSLSEIAQARTAPPSASSRMTAVVVGFVGVGTTGLPGLVSAEEPACGPATPHSFERQVMPALQVPLP
jgi:hypothetical protein